MQNTAEILTEIQKLAMHDSSLKERFLKTRTEKRPLHAFCVLCRELGYEIYEMDVIVAGEAAYAERRRSTNGGGENSPLLEGQDDFYEEFFAPLL